MYAPGRELAVDEAMIKFQGPEAIPPKETGFGVNGFFSRLEVYTRKKESTEKNLEARVVKDLTRDFQKWYQVFDNFFTSKALLYDLEAVGLYGCGTAQSNRKDFLDQLKKVQLKNT